MPKHRNSQGLFNLQVLVNKVPQKEGHHDDMHYVALPSDVDYELLVTVPMGEWKVIVTVDGLDITDGQRKPVKDCDGYIMRAKNASLDPRESGNYIDGKKLRRIIKGYRIDDESVATFRTGERKDSYASVLGQSENVGVIGVAFIAGYCIEREERREESCLEAHNGGFEAKGVQTLGGNTRGGDSRGIGTSFGSRVEDRVRRVNFKPTHTVAILELFYDREEVLEARGVAFPQPGPDDHFQFRRGCPIPPGWKG